MLTTNKELTLEKFTITKLTSRRITKNKIKLFNNQHKMINQTIKYKTENNLCFKEKDHGDFTIYYLLN